MVRTGGHGQDRTLGRQDERLRTGTGGWGHHGQEVGDEDRKLSLATHESGIAVEMTVVINFVFRTEKFRSPKTRSTSAVVQTRGRSNFGLVRLCEALLNSLEVFSLRKKQTVLRCSGIHINFFFWSYFLMLFR